MATGLPPPPLNDPSGSYAWLEWFRTLRNYISTTGSVPWGIINFAGSDIADIANRSHASLQGLQGGTVGERYHLTQADSNDITSKLAQVLAGFPRQTVGQEGWQDLLIPVEARVTGAGKPTLTALPGVLSYADAYQFTVGDKVSFFVHLPHDYKWGTPIYMHVHWLADTTSTNTLTWRLELSYARGYGVQAYGASTTVDITQAGTGTALTHNIAEPAEGSGFLPSNLETDGIIVGSLTLQANNLPVSPYAFFVDCHYMSDGTLTHERNRPFTKHYD